jgi:hypothetical protein
MIRVVDQAATLKPFLNLHLPNLAILPFSANGIEMISEPGQSLCNPLARVLIIGGTGVSYGAAPPAGTTWKDIFSTRSRTGRLVDFFDRAGLVDTVTDLLENPEERQRLGENARQFAIAHYDLETVCLPGQIAWVEG